jgi:hypothetical protein
MRIVVNEIGANYADLPDNDATDANGQHLEL